MPEKKTILDKIEDKAKEIENKIEQVLDDISADEERLTVTYPDAEKSPTPNKPVGP
jgi:hypothetical protein